MCSTIKGAQGLNPDVTVEHPINNQQIPSEDNSHGSWLDFIDKHYEAAHQSSGRQESMLRGERTAGSADSDHKTIVVILQQYNASSI